MDGNVLQTRFPLMYNHELPIPKHKTPEENDIGKQSKQRGGIAIAMVLKGSN